MCARSPRWVAAERGDGSSRRKREVGVHADIRTCGSPEPSIIIIGLNLSLKETF